MQSAMRQAVQSTASTSHSRKASAPTHQPTSTSAPCRAPAPAAASHHTATALHHRQPSASTSQPHRAHSAAPSRSPSRSGASSHVASASQRSSLSSSILSVLKDEQKYAAGSYRKDEELLEDPPNDFELDNPPGKRCLYLLKEHKDEQLIVELDLEEQVDAADDMDEESGEGEESDADELPPVSFSVQVVKEQGALSFRCVSDGEYVEIQELVLESPSSDQSVGSQDNDDSDAEDEDSDSDAAYTGPAFEQLDDTLQQAFLDYLEERGITAELGRYLQRLVADKAAVEYQAWLQRIRDFIAD